ncbi:MAG: Rpn family recombination-promoting nuclease/putative transposase [Alphaproteobacteria bacterium]|nr:Rpn family recombination-promoting nuclease/putative transposase [Alphaproteobacteria bacterium]
MPSRQSLERNETKNDYAFKTIFGTERNKDILIHFINDMITFKEKKPIVDVTFLKATQAPEVNVLKTSLVDILCRDEAGHQYIVEMQVAKERGFEKRAQYYAAKAYISQTRVGDEYHELKEVIFLAITDFVMFPNKKMFKSDHVILDNETHENDLIGFSFTFLELPKFNKYINELQDVVEKWMYFFKHANETSEKDLPKIIGNDNVIEKAYEALNRCSWNEQQLFSYDQQEKYDWSHQGTLDAAYDDGVEKGMEKGMEKGIEIRNLEIAKAMLLKNIDLEVISGVTGLSKEHLTHLSDGKN